MSETTKVKKLKLFVAVTLSVAATKRIAETVERLKRAAGPARIAWVPAANLHVTVKYLGMANPEAAEAVKDSLRALAHGRRGIDLGARGVGAFPNEKEPRVFWAGVQDTTGALAKLAVDVDKAMESLGFAKESRAYSPHVTFGRIKEGVAAAAELLGPYKQNDFGNSLVRDVILYESSVTSRGSEYVALARIPLEAPAYRAERQTREVEGDNSAAEEESEHGGAGKAGEPGSGGKPS